MIAATAATATKTIAPRGASRNVTRFNIGLFDNFIAHNGAIKCEYGASYMNSELISTAYVASLSGAHRALITEIGSHLMLPSTCSWYHHDKYMGSFTMNDILCDMGIRTHDGTVNYLPEPIAIELGKFINYFLPGRPFEKVDIMVGEKKMNVKLYYQYEREEIEHLVKIFFNRLDLIKPHHMRTQMFNVIDFITGFLESLPEDSPDKTVFANLFNVANPSYNENIMRFQNDLLAHLPDSIRIYADENGMYDTLDLGMRLYYIPAHYIFFAEHFIYSLLP